jgi:hypothetical protein
MKQHDVKGCAGVEVKLRTLRLGKFSTSQPSSRRAEQQMTEVVRPADGFDGESVSTQGGP